MLPYTKTTKEKLEKILELSGFKVRYEKGSFQSGYCLVHDQKVVVINKFFDLTGRLDALIEVLNNTVIREEALDDKLLKVYKASLSHYALASTENAG
jgi:hypothetical protein